MALLCAASGASAQARKPIVDDLRPAYATSADVAEGKRVADGPCACCHGGVGISATTGVPHVAGQRPSYLYSKLRAYQAGTRDDHTMESVVKFLNDDALVNVAAYYAAQQPRQPRVSKPLTLAEWVQRCDRCHGINGNSTDPRTPAIAAQRVDYLQKAMQADQGNQRRNSVMAAMSGSLTDADVANLAAYYASLKKYSTNPVRSTTGQGPGRRHYPGGRATLRPDVWPEHEGERSGVRPRWTASTCTSPNCRSARACCTRRSC